MGATGASALDDERVCLRRLSQANVEQRNTHMKNIFPSANNMLSRRELLCRCGTGFGAMALADLMRSAGLLAPAAAQASEAVNPLAPKLPPLPAKAKRVIHIFLNGGPSH